MGDLREVHRPQPRRPDNAPGAPDGYLLPLANLLLSLAFNSWATRTPNSTCPSSLISKRCPRKLLRPSTPRTPLSTLEATKTSKLSSRELLLLDESERCSKPLTLMETKLTMTENSSSSSSLSAKKPSNLLSCTSNRLSN